MTRSGSCVARDPANCTNRGHFAMEKVPMTDNGFNQLEEELKRLKSVERPAVIRAIAEAREHGDISENAEYPAAKDRQAFIEARVREIEDKISRAEVIDVSRWSGKQVKFGAKVKIADEDTDQETVYRIVGTDESDVNAGLLSVTSPLARALIGKTIGDSVDVITPSGSKSYEIVSVRFR